MNILSSYNAKERSRSLSSYYGMPGLNTMGMSVGMSSFYANQTYTSVQANNIQLNNSIDFLHSEVMKAQTGLDLTQANPQARNAGVRLAWLYEVEDIRLGGKGSIEGGWSPDEIQAMPQRVDDGFAGVKGAEGHHQKNAAHHPELQADPNNIRFFRNHDEHISQGHGGNTKKETDGPLIDKDKMLRDTVKRNNLKQEINNVATVALFAAGSGFVMGAAVTLIAEGVSLKTIRKAVLKGAIQAAKTTAYSLAGYAVGRIAGNAVADFMVKQVASLGIKLSSSASALLNQTVSGVFVAVVFLSVAYARLRVSGVSARKALELLAPVAALSLIGTIASIVITKYAGAIWGGVFGLVWGLGQFVYVKLRDDHTRALYHNIDFFRLERSTPVYVEGYVV